MGLSKNMFEGPIPPDLLCPLCGHVLVQPELSATCQHAFCSTCLQENVATPCPSCSAGLQSIPRRPAPAQTRLRLLELRIRCDHKCGQVMALGQLPHHVSHICPNTPIECEYAPAGCRKRVRRCDLAEHVQECDFRPVTCDACGYHTLFRDLHVHQSRKRCVEMRIKNQLIRAVRSTRKEVKRHQNHLQRQQVRADQFQRRLEIEHSKKLNTARRQRQMQKNYNIVPEDQDSFPDPINCNGATALNTDTQNYTVNTTVLSTTTPQAIPAISFMSLKEHTSNPHTGPPSREVVGNRTSEPSRISMGREIGNLASPRGMFSREKHPEQSALRASVSRERLGHSQRGTVQLDRITTSRDRHNQTLARLTASREKLGHTEVPQQQQQAQELFLTAGAAEAEMEDTIVSVMSSSDLEVHRCRNCRRPFREVKNKANSCRWHAGPIIELFGGTCYSCGRLDYQKGCMMGRHEF